MKVCWNLTSKCNRNCKFCFRDQTNIELSLDESLGVLDNLEKLDVSRITFAGGEPLMYKEFVALTKESKKRGIYNKLNTNASLLTKDNVKEYLKYIDKADITVGYRCGFMNPIPYIEYDDEIHEYKAVETLYDEKTNEAIHKRIYHLMFLPCKWDENSLAVYRDGVIIDIIRKIP